ncbi:hypothetical protein, partial [Anaerophilus nitritogenes]|uniref:hypothetical protein n=1 Tax=Anaerophilus nitritogenes TaxID=2498136 RepID=UPI0013EBFD09
MKYTGNLKLKKPDLADVVNVEDLNYNSDIIDQQITRTKDEVNGQLADYEYQTPQIVGSKIILHKKGDTKRLFFKMPSELNGTISISVDNGVTTKPLQDIDGNQITKLKKGFMEVVADANFFIYVETGEDFIQVEYQDFYNDLFLARTTPTPLSVAKSGLAGASVG